jgi:hypothetical protein
MEQNNRVCICTLSFLPCIGGTALAWMGYVSGSAAHQVVLSLKTVLLLLRCLTAAGALLVVNA